MDEEIEVLIVEDDIRIADIHRRFTEKMEGFKVIGTATTGEQAEGMARACEATTRFIRRVLT